MTTRYRSIVLAGATVALLAAAPLAQAHKAHVDFHIALPHLLISSHHGYARHYYYQPAAPHYHGRKICHLRHDDHGGRHYGYDDRHYHRHGHRY